MGLKSGTNAFWKAKNVTHRDLVVIHQKLFQKSPPIHIDVDVSILYMSILNDPKHTYTKIVTEIANRLVEILSCGFKVTPVFDGLERHHSKRDSWNRRTRKLLYQANASYCKQKAMAIGALIDNEGGSVDLNKKLKDLKKEAASLERQGIIRESSLSLMQLLIDKLFLIHAFEKNNMNGEVVKKPIMNAFQADSMMAFRVRYHFSDYVSSFDSDFGLLSAIFVQKHFHTGPHGMVKNHSPLKKEK